ncbi:hypothetical protein PPL_10415 [Heterostelium album PN500]|uniref:WD repeat-containing protein 37 n=1 Tax=Heterostelium pallidum (strain ATCC 26659 / Pp 5 / PN500) TaxID=670386 RepID=D3BR12_HETP5|nr:hypothetical protein PPL_10415 [Heterostelium album PN500]EFA76198.1 hypothetical protein PPL_10415 [Heterostelium album PN500]|eukprot:XP_020428331.1 hypothetical protein PPL_10415 [Heterostelium album PN500]
MEKEKLSKEIAKISNGSGGQQPSKERFKELLVKLENEYNLLWEENQELRARCGLPSTSKPSLLSSSSNTNPIKQTLGSKAGKLAKIKKPKHQKSSSSSKRDGSHKWIRVRDYVGHRDGIWEVTTSPWDIFIFATCSSDRTARIWSVDGSKMPLVYSAHTGTVNSVRFHPSEKLVCTASGDKTIHIFKVPTDRFSQSGMRSPVPQSSQSSSSATANISQMAPQQQPFHSLGIATSSSSAKQDNTPIKNTLLEQQIQLQTGGILSKDQQQQQQQQQQVPSSPILGRPSQNDKNKVKLWTPLLERQRSRDEVFSLSQPAHQQQQQQHQYQEEQFEMNDLSEPEDDFESDDDSLDRFDEDLNFNFNQQHHQHQNTQQQQHHQPPQLSLPQQQPPSSPELELRGSIDEIEQIQHNIVSHQQQQNEHGYNILRTPLLELKGHTGPVTAAVWTSNSTVVSASWDNSIRWWNTENGRTISTATGVCMEKVHRITNITSVPSLNYAITTSTDGVIRVWDARSSGSGGGPVESIHGHQEAVNSAMHTYDGGHIVSGGDDRTVKVWDIRQTKNCKTSIRCPLPINRLSVSQSTPAAVIAIPQDDGRISVYDINGNRKGKMRDQYKYGHKLMATSTAWSNDDSVIFSSSFDRRIISWATASD